jgi:hypothetical protein
MNQITKNITSSNKFYQVNILLDSILNSKIFNQLNQIEFNNSVKEFLAFMVKH